MTKWDEHWKHMIGQQALGDNLSPYEKWANQVKAEGDKFKEKADRFDELTFKFPWVELDNHEKLKTIYQWWYDCVSFEDDIKFKDFVKIKYVLDEWKRLLEFEDD